MQMAGAAIALLQRQWSCSSRCGPPAALINASHPSVYAAVLDLLPEAKRSRRKSRCCLNIVSQANGGHQRARCQIRSRKAVLHKKTPPLQGPVQFFQRKEKALFALRGRFSRDIHEPQHHEAHQGKGKPEERAHIPWRALKQETERDPPVSQGMVVEPPPRLDTDLFVAIALPIQRLPGSFGIARSQRRLRDISCPGNL